MKTECRNETLLGDMKSYRIMTHTQQVEDYNLRKQAKQNKKARSANYDYSQQK